VTSPNSYANAYDGTFNADDRLVAPWWIPDWTAQDKISIPVGNNLVVGPGFPTNLSRAITSTRTHPRSAGS
jgi:hypothetical protein